MGMERGKPSPRSSWATSDGSSPDPPGPRYVAAGRRRASFDTLVCFLSSDLTPSRRTDWSPVPAPLLANVSGRDVRTGEILRELAHWHGAERLPSEPVCAVQRRVDLRSVAGQSTGHREL